MVCVTQVSWGSSGDPSISCRQNVLCAHDNLWIRLRSLWCWLHFRHINCTVYNIKRKTHGLEEELRLNITFLEVQVEGIFLWKVKEVFIYYLARNKLEVCNLNHSFESLFSKNKPKFIMI